jgi:AAHS family 3-hydroxyphenylpropionic acid transporter
MQGKGVADSLIVEWDLELAPLPVRGTGVGAAVCVGRLGSVLGPLYAAGLLAGVAGSDTVLLGIFEPFVAIAGGAALALIWRARCAD